MRRVVIIILLIFFLSGCEKVLNNFVVIYVLIQNEMQIGFSFFSLSILSKCPLYIYQMQLDS